MAAQIPANMRAVGSTAVGQLGEWTLPVPRPAKGQVLIRVAASGVNPIDWKNNEDLVPLGKKRPSALGYDLAGTIVALGDGVTQFAVGDEVFGMTAGPGSGPEGTLAEYAIADVPAVAKKPAKLSMREAAAFPLALLTAWEGVMVRHTIKKGDIALVTGASGGVGQFAVQLLVHQGAKVYGLASEPKKDLVERYGATFVDYTKPEALEKIVKECTPNGSGFNYIYETLGGEWLDKALGFAAPLGGISEINGFAAHQLMNAGFKGLTLSFPMACLPTLYPDPKHREYFGVMLRDSVSLIEKGVLKVVVDDAHKYPFSKDGVEQTYKVLKEGKNRGKLVVDIIV